MLDSTGSHLAEIVICTLCPEKIFVQTYTPEVGHEGYPLKGLGPYIEQVTGIRNADFFRGSLFTIGRSESREDKYDVFSFTLEYELHEPYSYSCPLMPEMDLGIGKIFWVCQSCVEKIEDDSGNTREQRVQLALDHKIVEHVALEKALLEEQALATA